MRGVPWVIRSIIVCYRQYDRVDAVLLLSLFLCALAECAQ